MSQPVRFARLGAEKHLLWSVVENQSRVEDLTGFEEHLVDSLIVGLTR
jgi:hypothetical protein